MRATPTRTQWMTLLGAALGVWALAALGVCGCGPKAPPESETRPVAVSRSKAPAGEAKAKIVAYINVTSGCQEPTISALKDLDEQYGDAVTLEIVDFGDEGAGAKRWKESGYTCMTIEVNGSPDQVWQDGGQENIVRFQWPEGYSWVEKDLHAMVTAWVEGRAHVATEEEAALVRAPLKLAIQAEGLKTTDAGKEQGRLMIGNQIAIRFRVAHGDESPGARAARAADMVMAFAEGPPQPPEFKRTKTEAGWEITLGKKLVAVCTQADADAEKTDLEILSKAWLVGLRQAMAIAVRESQEDCETAPSG